MYHGPKCVTLYSSIVLSNVQREEMASIDIVEKYLKIYDF